MIGGNRARVISLIAISVLFLGLFGSQHEAMSAGRQLAASGTEKQLEILAAWIEPSTSSAHSATLIVEFQSSLDLSDVGFSVDFLEEEGSGLFPNENIEWRGSTDPHSPVSIALPFTIQEQGVWPIYLDLVAFLDENSIIDAFEVAYLDTIVGQVLRGDDLVANRRVMIGETVEENPYPVISRSSTARAPISGEVQIKGNVEFSGVEREGNNVEITQPKVLPGILLGLFDQYDLELGYTYSDKGGNFTFEPVDNLDDQELIVRVFSSGEQTVRVTDSFGFMYFYTHKVGSGLADGVKTTQISINADQITNISQPFYIYHKVAGEAYQYLKAQVNWTPADQLRIRWPEKCLIIGGGSCFTGSIHLHDTGGFFPDIILHELGHFVLSRFIGESKVIHACAPHLYYHEMFKPLVPACSWSEGWANYFEMAVQNDPDYMGFNLENVEARINAVDSPMHDGRNYEGLVAAALWDIHDSVGVSEAYDVVQDGVNGANNNGIWHLSTNQLPLTIEQFAGEWMNERGEDCETSALFHHHLMPFPPHRFSLTTTIDANEGNINVSPAPACPEDTYLQQSAVDLVVIEQQGYVFDRWELSPDDPLIDPAIDLTDPELTLTMDRDWEVTALFTPWPPPPPNLPALPVCGDQDGSERPFIKRCDQLDYLPEVKLFQVPGSGPVELDFDFVLREGVYNNELGFFFVDDARGAINGVLPGEPGYLQAFFDRAVMIFPSGSNAHTPDRSVQAQGGDILMFYLVQNGRLSTVIERNPENHLGIRPHVFFSLSELNPDSWDHLEGYEHPDLGYTQFGFEDLDRGGDKDFDDVVYNVSPRLGSVSGRVDLSPLNIEATAGDEISLTAYVIDENGDPVAHGLVHFIVEGPNAQTGTARTDPLGRATFTYLAENDGDDAVYARYKGWESNRSFVKAAPANPAPACTCVILCFFGGDSSRVASLVETADRVSLLYRLRDEIMAPADHGPHYIELFKTHTIEISALMLADEGLRDEGLAALEQFLPGVQALVDGSGGEVIVDAGHVQATAAFLKRLADEGSDALAAAIEAELERHPLTGLTGLTYEQAAYQLLNEGLSVETPGVIVVNRMSGFLNLTHSDGSNGKWEWTNHTGAPGRYWIQVEGEWMYFFSAVDGDQALFDPARPEDALGNRLAIAARKADFQKWFWCGITLRDEYGRSTGSGCHPDWSSEPYGAGTWHPWYQERIEQSQPLILQTLINTFPP